VAEVRPPIAEVRSGVHLRRWYWRKSELVELARLLEVSPSGGKQDLAARLCAALDGEQGPAPSPRPAQPRKPGPLAPPLSRDTVIPAGQRSSQQLRAFFAEQVGPGFRFDGAMREFVEQGAGRTLGEAVAHWHATRGAPRREIAPQFELNRFLRAWHEANPGGSAADARAAWKAHWSVPRDPTPGDRFR